MNHFIAPSLLAADFSNLSREVDLVNRSEAEFVHLDIMDGLFVPNISFGFPVIKAVKKLSQKPLDVHLMIVKPERYLLNFREAGADWLTVHIEACRHLHRTIQEIKEQGMKAGVSLNPHTSVSLLEDIIHDVDLVLIMSVNPGFGGQEFIDHTYKKIARLKDMIARTGSHALIEIDGGVDLQNAGRLFQSGVNILVAGTSIFHAPDPITMIRSLHLAGGNSTSHNP